MAYLYGALSLVLSTILSLLSGIDNNLFWKIPLFALALFIALVLIHAIILGVSMLAVNLKKDNSRVSRYYRILTLTTVDLLFTTLGIRIHTTGLEKIPQDKRSPEKKFVLLSRSLSNTVGELYLSTFCTVSPGFSS